MDPLWTDAHAPDIEDFPQDDVQGSLERAATEPMNLLLHGPPGAGKTAAVRALARRTHDDPEADLVELNVDDFFSMTKKEVSQDPRFEHFISNKRRRESSKADLINHVLKETAGNAPVSGSYKTVLLDNAETVREDFQQALRRVMERYHESTQFVIATRQPAKLIAPIRSRCLSVPVRSPTEDETVGVLRDIAGAEGVPYDDTGLGYVATYAEGNLRKAILGAQTVAVEEEAIEGMGVLEPLSDVGVGDRVESMLDDAEAGEFSDARSELDDLLVEEGLSGAELLAEILDAGRSRYDGERLARLHRLAGDIDFEMAGGTNERVHLSHLLAELGA